MYTSLNAAELLARNVLAIRLSSKHSPPYPSQVPTGGGWRVVVGIGEGGRSHTEVQSVRICHSLQILSWQVLVVSGFSRCWQR